MNEKLNIKQNMRNSGITLIEGGSLFAFSFLADVGLNPNSIQVDEFLAAIAQILVILYTILKLYNEGGKKISWKIIEKLFELLKIVWKLLKLPLESKRKKKKIVNSNPIFDKEKEEELTRELEELNKLIDSLKEKNLDSKNDIQN